MLWWGYPEREKVFFANQFSETFGAPAISYDRIRYELFSEPTFSKDEQEVVKRIALYQLGETLKSKHTCIIDGDGESRTDRMALRRIAKEADYDTLVVWVQTDAVTTKFRATHRNSRRKGDEINPNLSPEQYEQHAKRLTPPSTGEQYIVISGKHTYAAQLKTVLTKLTAPREQAEKITPPPRNEQPLRPMRRNILIK
ncbi:hypothetical protein TM7_0035 [candidate division TM7 genomosp. GTL1]|nr:hypothetical protein TM7_0035 [candidate division TM7 genomosp. GTL1]